jgi:serine/threonine protein kinase
VTKIGRYEVESEIGRGAMGIVYLAHDPRLRRRVAVKTFALPEGLSHDEENEYRERFLREAQAAAGLSHPGIVTIFDADEDPDRNLPYIAMEYVPGKSLKEILEREKTFELERVVALVDLLAEALQTAHEAGIVHRDIKPANLVVRESDGATKIADFGVARFSSSTLTQSGASIGTPAYMSPEQIQCKQIDGRSDLFSLAVILYELLCGTRPFSGEDTSALTYSVVHETPVPITRRAEGLPPGLDSFFDRALAKTPARRFPDGSSFRQAFEKACRRSVSNDVEATGQQTVRLDRKPPQNNPSRRRAVMISGAALFLIWAGWFFFGEEEAHIRFDVKSGIESGELTLLVDGDEVYQRRLSATREKQGFIKKMLDQDLETFEASIEVSPGRREVAAHVLPAGMTSGYQDAIVIDLEPGETRRIKLATGRRAGSTLSLKSD